jgi:hypothetical protein
MMAITSAGKNIADTNESSGKFSEGNERGIVVGDTTTATDSRFKMATNTVVTTTATAKL